MKTVVMTNFHFILLFRFRKNNKINKEGRKNIEQTSADTFGDQQPDICVVETGKALEISVQTLANYCIDTKADFFYDLKEQAGCSIVLNKKSCVTS